MAEIYLLTFPSGKRYVGAVWGQNAESRFGAHSSLAAKNVAMTLYDCWRKEGKPKLKVLARVPDKDWQKEEVKQIAKHDTLWPKGLNRTTGGWVVPEQAKAAALKANIGRKKSSSEIAMIVDRNKKRVWKESSKAKIAEFRKKNPMSEETKRKISKSVSGKGNPFYGKVHSEESKKKMAQARAGKKLSLETRIKMSISHQKRRTA